jgi:photosystem II stability/assembly factor-like uncharacterized protein
MMLSIKLSFIVFFTSILTSTAQKLQYSLSPVALNDGNNYTSIFMSDDSKHGWISGSYGKILFTSDGGKNWREPDRKITRNALASIYFLKDNLRGMAVGNSGTVIATADGGRTWRQVAVPTTADLRSVSFSVNENEGIIAGRNGVVLLSHDRGESWTIVDNVDTYDFWQAGFFPGSKKAFVCGASTSFLISDDSRTTWKDHISEAQNDQNDSASLFSVVMDKSGQKIFAGGEGRLFKSVNGGLSWTIIPLHTKSNLMNIWFDDKFISGWLVSGKGEIFQTTDGGNTWRQNFSLDDPDATFYWVQFSKDNQKGWVVGGNNILLRTDDGGKTWNYQRRPLFDIFDAILQRNGKLGFLAGSHGNLVKSEDDFEHCTRISPPEFTTFINAIVFDSVRQQIWMAADTNSIIARCDVDGRNWRILYSEPRSSYMQSLVVSQEDNFICAVGGNSNVLLSDLAGEKWKKAKVDTGDFHVHRMYYESKQHTLYAVGRFGKAYKSMDKGKTWHRMEFPDSSQWLTGMGFDGTGVKGFMTSTSNINEPHLFKTTDGGTTWNMVDRFPANGGLQTIRFGNNQNNIIITGIQGNIYKSADDGETWFEVNPGFTFQRLTCVLFDEKDNPTIVGYGGTILRPQKVDLFPDIRDYYVKDTADGFKPSFTISDDELHLEQSITCVTVPEAFIEGADARFNKWTAPFGQLKTLPVWPASIFKPNTRYTYRLTLFDGWNIISKDTSFFFGKPFWARVRSYMHWDQFPTDANSLKDTIAINLGLLTILYIIVVLSLFVFSPGNFVAWHEAVANSKLPFPEKMSKFLVLYLIGHERSLNAFVSTHLAAATTLFFDNKDVSSRPHWVPAPFELDHVDHMSFVATDLSYIPGLSEIRPHLEGNRVIISIEGPGGVGKSSLAIQLAKWAYHEKRVAKLWNRPVLPVFINNLNDDLDKLVVSKLKYLTDSSVISESLSKAILRKKKVLVIVDGLSEMQALKPEFIDPQKGASDVHAVIYTSRMPTTIPQSTIIIPFGLKLTYLDNLIDGFTNAYVGANRFEDQREVLRSRIKIMIGTFGNRNPDKQIPLNILRLIIEHASKIMDRGGSLQIELPNSYYSLVEDYLSDLLRKVNNPDHSIVSMRAAAMVSLGLMQYLDASKKSDHAPLSLEKFKPQWVSANTYTVFISEADIQLFKLGGILIESGWLGEKQFKFQNDPIAEYLAASEICIAYQNGNMPNQKIKEILGQSLLANDSFYILITEVAKFKKIILP